jgi:ribosomal protein L32E
MKPIHRKIHAKSVARFDKFLTQVVHWKGHHPHSYNNHPVDVCQELTDMWTGRAPINLVPAAKALTPGKKAKIMRKCRTLGIDYGNEHRFKELFVMAVAGHSCKYSLLPAVLV